MDYKKIKASQEAITRDVSKFDTLTGNLYETVVVLSKRANTISSALRHFGIYADRRGPGRGGGSL